MEAPESAAPGAQPQMAAAEKPGLPPAAREGKPDHLPEEHGISAEVRPIVQQLHGIHRKLEKLKATAMASYAIEDVNYYKKELVAIDRKRAGGPGGIFAGRVDPSDPTQTIIPEGQGVAGDLLARCFEEVAQLESAATPLEPEMEQIFKQISGIRAALIENQDMIAEQGPGFKWDEEKLAHVRRYQGMLDRIEEARTAGGGVFAGRLGGDPATGAHAPPHVPAGQAVCSELLEECYELVRSLIADAEAKGA